MNNCPNYAKQLKEAEKKVQESLKDLSRNWKEHANLYCDLIRANYDFKQCVKATPTTTLSNR